MEDLSGLSWTPTSPNDSRKPPPMSSGHLFPSIPPVRRYETSGRSTPLSASSGPSNPPSKSPTPANDSFANLVSFNSSNPDKNLSLIERQKRLQEERARKEAETRSRFEAQYGSQNNQFWDSLERAGSKPSATTTTHQAAQADEDDLLAAFNASAPVDASTHFPVPSPSPSPHIETTPSQAKSNGDLTQQGSGMHLMDDDDPFGLNQLESKPAPPPQPAQNDDDDFLGLLGKPVSEFTRPEPQPSPALPSSRTSPQPPPKPLDDVDRAVAELVDMGFPADKASQALRKTESGTDVQAAVGWLLNQAHAESRQKARGRPTPSDHGLDQGRERSERRGREVPTWMSEERPSSRSNRDNRSPAAGEKDPTQVAATFGNNLLKTANSWWKTGSKRVQQVVNDLNTEHDPNTPRWMRDASAHEEPRPQEHVGDRRTAKQPQPENLTDEALILEQGPPLPSRHITKSDHKPRPGPESHTSRGQRSPIGETRTQQATFLQNQPRQQTRESKASATRRLVEEQSAQAYVSPARRKRPVPPPAPEQNVDLFESSAPSTSPQKPAPSTQRSQKPSPPTSLPAWPKAPPRDIPSVSQAALASTHQYRQKGTEAYKRGDYASAHEAFTGALSTLPDKHPINIIIRGNRAMTALKIGEPKTAIADADSMLEVIGPSKGEAEIIELGNGEPSKPMKELFGKALVRKAEALEQLEKWGDAAAAWKLAVQTGHGGSTSIQGRNRCEKAAGISKPAPTKRPPAPAPKKPSALDDLTGSTAAMDSAAVSRLRAANQAADRADEEKFALSEGVDSRLAAWKNGKQDNLRALLGSLDTVLWPEAGWKKANMSELIMPNKVKIQYMKGISKVHPDKVRGSSLNLYMRPAS